MLIFLKFYLSHLIADFVLQPESIAKQKTRVSRVLIHSTIHIIIMVVIINVGINKKIAIAIGIIATTHAICDYIKAKFTKDGWLAFSADQGLHFLIIAGISIWLSSTWANAEKVLRILTESPKLYLFLCVYIAVIFGGSYFVQKVSQYFMSQIDKTLLKSRPGLRNAGRYIGWLERALITTFVVVGYSEGIGLLLAAKTIARYPEMKSDEPHHFAEYFLIGTLTSVSLALVAGFLVLKLKDRIIG